MATDPRGGGGDTALELPDGMQMRLQGAASVLHSDGPQKIVSRTETGAPCSFKIPPPSFGLTAPSNACSFRTAIRLRSSFATPMDLRSSGRLRRRARPH